jgi:SAM-dependent methyltransferase
MSFHHWAEQARGLSETGRVLRPGGRFLLADHFVLAPHRLFYATRSRRERFHTPVEIDRMLAGAGFEGCEWRELYRIGPFLIVSAVSASRTTG